MKIFANWKLNPTSKEEVVEIVKFSDKEEVVLFPPFLYLKDVKEVVMSAQLGGQNCFSENSGAYTGEVSPRMLKNMGCDYVILGHSERREHQKETSEDVNRKIKRAVEEELTPVVCIGEKENNEKAIGHISGQLKETLQDVLLEKIIIAYEPVFAIGTGVSCPIDVARERRLVILEILSEYYKKEALVKILYGGSVNSENALSYINEAGFDGLLIGGASLKKEEMVNIIKDVS